MQRGITVVDLVPARTRMKASEFLNQEEDEDCTDSLPSEEIFAFLAEDVHNLIERWEDSNNEIARNAHDAPTKDAVKRRLQCL